MTTIKTTDVGSETTPAHASDANQLTPQRIRILRERSPSGELPEGLRPTVADALEREEAMTPFQIFAFRESHGGMSPSELARSGGAR